MTANVLNYVDQTDGIGDNKVHINGTVIIDNTSITANKLKNVLITNDITVYDGDGAINISGIALIDGGTGISGLTLAAPAPGVSCKIKIRSITSGDVVVTTDAGVTFDGTNNTATFNAEDDELVMGYESAIKWSIYTNNSVVLSPV